MKQAFSADPYDFSLYRLSVSQPVVRVFAAIICIFNLLLLIPDMIHLEASKVALVCVLRLLFSGACGVLFLCIRRFRSFKTLSSVTSGMELLAAAVYLWVFKLYEQPDFLIQLLGVMMIILVVFMVPNRIAFALGVALFSTGGFMAVSFGPFAITDTSQYVAAGVYLLTEVALGFTFAWIFLKYQRREYAARTELQKVYATDPLTQVGNRFRLEKEAEKWLAFCNRHSFPLSLVLVDIDDMKQINDLYGHLTGDATICELVATICGHLRKNDVCVRWGGDEFVLLLPGTEAAEAYHMVERIRAEVESHTFCAQSRITCSFGIAGLHQADTLEKLLRLADASLYQAKKQGKNTACTAEVEYVK